MDHPTFNIAGRHVRLGLNHHALGRDMLCAEKYWNASLPEAKPTDWTDIGQPWGMMRNDVLGDCVEAGKGHMTQLATKFGQGKAVTPSDGEIQSTYFTETGGPDVGLNIPDSLDYWAKHPLAGYKIEFWGAINEQNTRMLALGNQLFGGVACGFSLPNNFEQALNAGVIWSDISQRPNDNNAHDMTIAAVYARGGDKANGGHPLLPQGGVALITWGMVQLATWNWLLKYITFAAVVSHPAWRGPLNPSQVADVGAWQADFAAITGKNPPPAPVPPAPPINPPPPVASETVGIDLMVRSQSGKVGRLQTNVQLS